MGKTLASYLLTTMLSATASAQAPAVSAVENNYSFTLPGSPTYGIAQGSVFVIFGAAIGPAQTPVLPDLSKGPLVTNLKGVTISVTVNGTTVQAIPYYVSASQIAAILPSNTPVGTGTITVTYNSQTSASAPIKVVSAAFGIDTLNGSGSGPAVAQNASNNYTLLSPGNAANPEDVIVLWGTGLGPSTGDETKYPFPQIDLTNRSGVKVYIGGQPAQTPYAGRSQFPGVDQVNAVVPAGVSGCSVSVVVQTGNYVSNSATIAVAATGRTCADQSTTGLLPADLQALLNKPTLRIGSINLSKSKSQTPAISVGGVSVPGSTVTSDSASATFDQFTTTEIGTGGSGGLFQTTSLGSCTAFQFQGTADTSTPPTITSTVLDAGTVAMKLPDGSTQTLTKDQGGSYSLTGSDGQGSQKTLFIPTTGGQFSFTNTGGVDVGQISGATITMPPAMNWTNMDAINTITKSQGVTVNWDKSTPYTGFVTVAGASFQLSGSANNSAIFTGFSCTAPYSAGTFTVPGYVLLTLLSSQNGTGGIAFPTGSLSLGISATPVRFTAPSIDYATLNASSTTGKSVTYQ